MPRIGVTGHRVLAELKKIETGVQEALRRIEAKYPGEPLTVISSLAEGADRIVARIVLDREGSSLIVPLPLAEADYLTDFKSPESQAEFSRLLGLARTVQVVTPRNATRNAAYEAAGNYVLNNSDVLVTIWDGKHAQGQGGTGDIVTRARKRGLPVAWVHAGNRRTGTLEPTSLGEEQGRLTFENI